MMNSEQKIHPDPPPTYNETMQQAPYPPMGNLDVTISAVPSNMNPSAPPAPGFVPPPAGFINQQPQQSAFVPSYGSVEARSAAATVIPATQIVVVGGCPVCRIGILEEDFTCCGICCAICFFPLGIICCLMMKQKRCSNCGTII